MAVHRIVGATARVLVVLIAVLAASRLPARAEAPPDEMAVDRALRKVLRPSLALSERLAAAEVALRGWEQADGETLVRAGLALLGTAPEAGGWLLLRGTDRERADSGLASAGRERVTSLLAGPAADEGRRAAWVAAGTLLGHRPDDAPGMLTAAWPPSPFVAAVLRREGAWPPPGGLPPAAADAVRVLRSQLPVLRALDRADHDDPAVWHEGLDALLEAGPAALPVLLAEARRAAAGVPPGRVGRATRALLALGLLGEREATGALVAALDAPDGWVQVAAATALGDLGDPAAAVALCRKITYRGDVLRPRDQWDYPGERETTVPREAWASAEYYAVDCAAADALLRLGVAGAVGWLVHAKLDPAKANFRIRVLQDAVDAIARAVPSSPVDRYNVDAGLPHRRAAFEALLSWWEERAFDGDLLATAFPADDPAFVREARRMVERLRGRSVMELQIAQESCALLGPAATPVLLETLALTTNRVLRTEIARALGAVRDVRAVPTIVELTRDPRSFLRAVAATSLGAYVGRHDAASPRLVALLDDREGAPRVAALTGLVAADPSPALLAALRAHTPEAYGATFGTDDRDYRMAWTVGMLVQEGWAHWSAVRAGLGDEERYVRRTWWDHLRRALRLPYSAYDANTDPSTPGWTPIDEARVREALRARRGR